MPGSGITRRQLLGGAAAAAAAFTIVPRHVLGRMADQLPPSETLGGALVGCGQRGDGTIGQLGPTVVRIVDCDVKFLDRVDNKKFYTDFRRVLDRKDVDVVAIATPPHWHALVSIAAMQAGKDVLCEKPFTRFIAEGRAVVEAENRYNRIIQVGTFGRFIANREKGGVLHHKIMRSGLLKNCRGVHICRPGGTESRGLVNVTPQPVPPNLDWDMYCGPSPLRPYHKDRTGFTHRGYWDYEGGGLADTGQHVFDPIQWRWGKDDTSPVEIESYAPKAHPEVTGMWGWVELKYADGLTFVMESREWGKPYDRLKGQDISLADLSEDDRKKVQAMPDPEPMVDFLTAVKTRRRSGGSAEPAHRGACLLHLANISIRVGRKIKYDPVREQIIGDDEANRLVNQPMRAPWHL